ncbi:MAG: hypothetical protein PF570_03175 [Candidatus Cloacimonetes bacterium]|jgi:hypothetical protein|nr:hypothetical protein [Candidatus Cloacimonadota bacterium]
MKVRLIIILVLLSTLILSCTSTDVEKISIVTVTLLNGGEPQEVELSHSVEVPITKSGAIFIMDECCEGYNSSLGDPELIEENWEFYWSPEYPDFEIKVNRNNGNVEITHFG